MGVGGVTTALDILDYQRAGAVLVQVVTAFLGRRAGVFYTLLSELISLTTD